MNNFRPLIIEDRDGNKQLINCYCIASVVFWQSKDWATITITNSLANNNIIISAQVAQILCDQLSDEVFFSQDHPVKAILEQPKEE